MSSSIPPNTSEEAQAFLQQILSNPDGFLAAYRELRDRAETPTSSIHTPPPAPSLNVQTLAQAMAQAMAQNLPDPPPQPRAPLKSEKLPDIPEYEGDLDKLDAWEQALVQRMSINHDRYPTDREKIGYAESRLTIGKKAHNLMNSYRANGLCTLTDFSDYRRKLRAACGNPFEQEDARTYIRNLKQGSMPFDEYHNLLTQKRERSEMEDESLIDAMKDNVNYTTQLASIAWRLPNGQRPKTFAEYVKMYSEVDRESRQIKHRLPHQSSTSRSEAKRPSNPAPRATVLATPVSVPVAPAAPSSGDPMDLSAAMAAVKGKKLSEPNVRDLCKRFNLCFYCKLQHPGGAKDCPSKRSKPAADLRSGVIEDLDNESVAGGVPLGSGKA